MEQVTVEKDVFVGRGYDTLNCAYVVGRDVKKKILNLTEKNLKHLPVKENKQKIITGTDSKTFLSEFSQKKRCFYPY